MERNKAAEEEAVRGATNGVSDDAEEGSSEGEGTNVGCLIADEATAAGSDDDGGSSSESSDSEPDSVLTGLVCEELRAGISLKDRWYASGFRTGDEAPENSDAENSDTASRHELDSCSEDATGSTWSVSRACTPETDDGHWSESRVDDLV